jgi:hypothetical protein
MNSGFCVTPGPEKIQAARSPMRETIIKTRSFLSTKVQEQIYIQLFFAGDL